MASYLQKLRTAARVLGTGRIGKALDGLGAERKEKTFLLAHRVDDTSKR